MAIDDIEQLLQKCMGLHSATVGSSTVSQAVEQRMRDCGIDSLTAYEQVLRHSPTELDALIDTVIIPETWFFRDRNPFAAFNAWLTGEWMLRHAHRQLRILSVPCSTGEEAYTLAMCLADCGIPRDSAHIDAVDISSSNIEKALAGEYGNNSFRGNDLAFRERHFTGSGRRYRVSDDIRARVRFDRANMLDASFLVARQPYHVVFCRNLLIYFDRPTQHRAIDRLDQLLTDDGILFLGHSETSLLLDRDFTALDHNRCFGFRRGQRQPAWPVAEKNGRQQRTPASRRRRVEPAPAAAMPFAQATRAAPTAAVKQTPADDRELLERAFSLADQGHLDEAAEHCETLLRQQIHQVDAHYLLGLIREAAGNSQAAEQMFRKAIYMDPDHYEALTHLSVICARQGDAAAARRFRERAERAAGRAGTGEAVE